MKEITAQLKQYGFPEKDLRALVNFKSRDGFQVIDDQDLSSMLNFFQQYPEDFQHLIPIMSDGNSNYLCVSFHQTDFGKICYLSHDEIDLTPVFSSISQLISVIESHSEAWDFPEIPPSAHDVHLR
ncbi:SMI1/KNR4 family protein [Pedobacter sp. GR22-6]|uniref:SMI1/KNR4 family protein n=1 Tax=Pedobacter sp. GR22-6 TaxID=3127957 RepID=UPI00307D3874